MPFFVGARFQRIPLAVLLISFIVIAEILVGCAGNLVKPISPKDKSEFENANSAVVVRYAPPGAMINWGATGPALVDWPGDLKAEYIDQGKMPGGNVIMSRHSAPDPIVTVAQQFISGLKAKTGITELNIIESPMPLPVQENVARYKDQYNEPYVIEIQPEANLLGWGFSAQVLSPTTYKFNHVSVAKIVRQSDSAVIWKGRCFVSGQNDDALNVSFDEMVSKDNAKVKSVVEDGLQKCAQMLVDQYVAQK